MRIAAGAVVALLAGMAALAAVAALVALPGAATEYGPEPENVYALILSAGVCLLLAGYWTFVARQLLRGPMAAGLGRTGLVATAAAVALGVALVVLGAGDSLDGPVFAGVGAVTVASAVLYAWLGRGRDRRSTSHTSSPDRPPSWNQ